MVKYPLLFFHSCPVSSHHLIINYYKIQIQGDIYNLRYSLLIRSPFWLPLSLSFPSSSKLLLSFSFLLSSYLCLICLSLSSCYLVISTLSFFLDFSYDPSFFPTFDLSVLLWVDLLQRCCAIIFRNCESMFKESTCIKYSTAVQEVLFMFVSVYEDIKTVWSAGSKRRTWSYLLWDLVCSLTLCCVKGKMAACVWGTSLHSVKLSFLSGFGEKVKLFRISDSTETLSLRIQLDYSGQMMKINQNPSAFSSQGARCFQRFTIIA